MEEKNEMIPDPEGMVHIIGFKPVKNIKLHDMLGNIILDKQEYVKSKDEKVLRRMFEHIDLLYLLSNGNRLPPGMAEAVLEGTMLSNHPEGRRTHYHMEPERDLILVEHFSGK